MRQAGQRRLFSVNLPAMFNNFKFNLVALDHNLRFLILSAFHRITNCGKYVSKYCC